jgi:predicted AAA+ superfamily ATPase
MVPYTRTLAPTLLSRATQWPVVTVTGPRQSGKTTLCRAAFPHLAYANLERPDTREFASADPRGFLAQFPNGAVLDEIQRTPALLSWLQVLVDEDRAPSRFILTGSHSFELMGAVAQSLAGRTALLQLLPMSLAELRSAGLPTGTDRLLHAGGYPRIHADGLDPAVALADYVATYVERDLRQLIELRDLDAFRRFLRLAAGRVGQVLNLHSLAADSGISDPTAKAWVGLLEHSFIVRRLAPWHANLGKRLVKSPKLYFCDTGLAAWLLGISQEGQLAAHPLRGALFENLVVMEFVKHALHHGLPVGLHYYRDSTGLEVDLVVEQGLPPGQLGLVEVKSGQTVAGSFLQPLHKVSALLGPEVSRRMLVYGGDELHLREGVEIVGLQAAAA